MKIFNFNKLSVMIAALLLSFSVMPINAKMSKQQAKVHQFALQDIGPVYENKKVSDYVERIGRIGLAQSPHAEREYYFFVLDSEQVNAFATGLDQVYITRGMLALLNSEAQLMGVLGHEIGHNVAKHSRESKAKKTKNKIIATVASILVGNSSLGDAIYYNSEVNRYGFEREQELEADKLGAQYLFKANYDPQEMLAMLGVLKDQDTLLSKTAGGAGYHGLFASHPKTDKRLHKVINQAGQLPPGEALIGRTEYRQAVEGMVYGPNLRDNAPEGYDRYIHKNLGITFVHPEDWSLIIKGAKIILKDAEQTVQLKISTEKTVDKSQTTEQALKAKFPDNLSKIEKLNPQSERDEGSLAKHQEQRVGLVTVARNTFHLQGIARNNKLTEEQDQALISIMRSFRRLGPQDAQIDSVKRIYFERLEPGDTFASLSAKLGKVVSEDELRLLNGYYPKGEAEPGTWIKLIRTDAVK